MHAYSEPPPRAVARTATVLHQVRNRTQKRVSLSAEEWTPVSGSAFSLDALRADVEPGASCCFASAVGSELTLTASWGSEPHERRAYQLRLPRGGGLPSWFPVDRGVKHSGLRELRGAPPTLPQWLLATDIVSLSDSPDSEDALSSLAEDIPDALRRAGCASQALLWEIDPPGGCQSGPCTVFGIPDNTPIPSHVTLSALSVPDVALFFDPGAHLEGVETTSDRGTLRYASHEGLLRIAASTSKKVHLLNAEITRRLPVRTRERQRVVYALSNVRLAPDG
jgi:hypothetical protein